MQQFKKQETDQLVDLFFSTNEKKPKNQERRVCQYIAIIILRLIKDFSVTCCFSSRLKINNFKIYVYCRPLVDKWEIQHRAENTHQMVRIINSFNRIAFSHFHQRRAHNIIIKRKKNKSFWSYINSVTSQLYCSL